MDRNYVWMEPFLSILAGFGGFFMEYRLGICVEMLIGSQKCDKERMQIPFYV